MPLAELGMAIALALIWSWNLRRLARLGCSVAVAILGMSLGAVGNIDSMLLGVNLMVLIDETGDTALGLKAGTGTRIDRERIRLQLLKL